MQTVSLKDALDASVSWLKRNWWRMVIVSAASFVVAWVWNVWLMAYRLNGHGVGPGHANTIATADGKAYNIVYWMLLAAVPLGLLAYGRERGGRTTLREMAGVPKRVLDSLSAHPNVTSASRRDCGVYARRTVLAAACRVVVRDDRRVPPRPARPMPEASTAPGARCGSRW